MRGTILFANSASCIWRRTLWSILIVVWSPYSKGETLTVQLEWWHTASSVGLYAAIECGFFADEGLEVRLLEGGPAIDPVAAVVTGKADIGVANGATVVIGRSHGYPIKAISAQYRLSPVVFLSLQSQGIVKPQQMRGKRIIANQDTLPILLAMLGNVGLARNQYTVLDLDPKGEYLIDGSADVIAAFIGNLSEWLQQRGYPTNAIFPSDYRVHSYSKVHFALDNFIDEQPALLKRYLRAYLKGWQYILQDVSRVDSLLAKYITDPEELMKQQGSLDSKLPLLYGQDDEMLGYMQVDHWSSIVELLAGQGLIGERPPVHELFTNALLPR